MLRLDRRVSLNENANDLPSIIDVLVLDEIGITASIAVKIDSRQRSRRICTGYA